MVVVVLYQSVSCWQPACLPACRQTKNSLSISSRSFTDSLAGSFLLVYLPVCWKTENDKKTRNKHSDNQQHSAGWRLFRCNRGGAVRKGLMLLQRIHNHHACQHRNQIKYRQYCRYNKATCCCPCLPLLPLYPNPTQPKTLPFPACTHPPPAGYGTHSQGRRPRLP